MTDFDPVSSTSDHHSGVMYPTTENNAVLNGHTTTVQSAKGTVVGGKVRWKEFFHTLLWVLADKIIS
jgi:hypothetical protein